jgi:hypothetical protein
LVKTDQVLYNRNLLQNNGIFVKDCKKSKIAQKLSKTGQKSVTNGRKLVEWWILWLTGKEGARFSNVFFRSAGCP